MKRTFDRTLQVLVWGLLATIVWALVAMTPWAAARSVLGAGPGYANALEPLAYSAGALLVAISGTLLIQRAHAAVRQRRTPSTTPPADRHVAAPRRHLSQPIPTGRTMADLPPRPPVGTPA